MGKNKQLAVGVSRKPEKYLQLRQQWISGTGKDGLIFDLTCGAGLGGSALTLSVTKGDQKITEEIDIRELVTTWVESIEEENQCKPLRTALKSSGHKACAAS